MSESEKMIQVDNKANYDAVLSSLSNVEIYINEQAYLEAIYSWVQSVTSLELDSAETDAVFKPLIEVGVGTTYIPSLKEALFQLTSFVEKTGQLFNNNVDEQTTADTAFEGYVGTGGRSGSTGNYSNNYGGNNVSVNPNTDVNNNDLDTEIDSSIKVDINELKFSELNQMLILLGSLSSNKNITDLLKDSSNATELQKAILASSELSSDMKELVSKMDVKVLKATLQSLYNEKLTLSDTSKTILNTYLNKISLSTDSSVTELLKDSKGTFNSFSEYFTQASSSEIMNNITKIYEGAPDSEVNTKTTEFVKSFVDTVAEEKGVLPEELLYEASNATYIKDKLSDLSKTVSYISVMSNVKNVDSVQGLLR